MDFKYVWVLWYHDPELRDYSLSSYIKLEEVNTPEQFWTITDSIPKECWECGMFFFMRKGFPPLWECAENKNGGAWSKKIDAAQAQTSFIDLMVHCASNELLTKSQDTLVGISISPKGLFHIIKIWNTTTTVSDKSTLNPSLTYYKVADDVTYTSHTARPK